MRSAFVLLQYLLPQHTLSRGVLRLTRLRWRWVKDALIGAFLRGYAPDLSDAAEPDPHAFESFNAFFTRALREGARPLPGDPAALASPVDGTVSQAGPLSADLLLQAKGHEYSVASLLAGAAKDWGPRFVHGSFATIYLAPYNYHRIHMPCEGTLREAWYVPGRLFSVNQRTAAEVPGLFARNERVVLLFEGDCGPFAVILVGALFVGSMSTVWHGDVAPRRPRRAARLELPAHELRLPRGAELGRFNMGSTVILLFAKDQLSLAAQCQPGCVVRMGEALGRLGPARPPGA